MNFRNIVVPLGVVGVLVFGYMSYGLPGLAAVGGGLLMWALLHFTRLMTVLRKASGRPIGHVGSAVMLNAKLRPGVNLMHVVAMTRSLGQLLSDEGTQPELYRWTDGTRSFVTCEFRNGKLVKWEMVRPSQDDAPAAVAELPPAP